MTHCGAPFIPGFKLFGQFKFTVKSEIVQDGTLDINLLSQYFANGRLTIVSFKYVDLY
jgi:hypothetical protein